MASTARDFLGCPLHALSPEAIVAHAGTAIRSNRLLVIEGLNVAKLIQSRRDARLMQALGRADIVHADGAGIMLGAKALGIALPPRRAGIDLMVDLLKLCAGLQAKVFLLGATAETVRAAAQALKQTVPGLDIVGIRDGYFTEAESAGVAAQIKASGASLLLVGISSPKKEMFLDRYAGLTGVSVAMGVGGSFDVHAGHIRRAPRWMQRAGFEWLFRLLSEPRRLAWRYLDTNAAYGLLLLRTCWRWRVA